MKFKIAWKVNVALERLCRATRKTPLYRGAVELHWLWGKHVAWPLNVKRLISGDREPDII